MTDTNLGDNSREQLKSIIERVERLELEKKAAASDIRDVFTEAKGNGFDVKALRTLVRMRSQDDEARRQQQEVLAVYMHAIGML